MGILNSLFTKKRDITITNKGSKANAANNSVNAVVKIVGIGGCGNNAIRRLVECREHGVEYIAIDSDNEFLQRANAEKAIHVDLEGLPEKTPHAGEPAMREAITALEGSDLIVFVCGLGGNTASLFTPILAEAARELGAYTICYTYMPLLFEGQARMTKANTCLAKLEQIADAVISIKNDEMIKRFAGTMRMEDAFKTMDASLSAFVHAIVRMLRGGFITLPQLRRILKTDSLLSVGMAIGAPDVVYDSAMQNAWGKMDVYQAKAVLAYVETGLAVREKEMVIEEQVRRNVSKDALLLFESEENALLGNEAMITLITIGHSDK